ncbi:unnamed protein product [Caenorhabditis brenneri]
MVTRTFPLLVLPYLALCNVLDLFTLASIIHFSFCTIRTQRLATRKPNGKLEIILKAQKQPEFYLRLNNQQMYKFVISPTSPFLPSPNWRQISLNGMVVVSSTMPSLGFTKTFWDDVLNGIEKVGTYITGLLKSPITEIQFLSENNMIQVIDWVASKQKSIENCSFGTTTTPDRYLTHLLTNLRITDHFDLIVKPFGLWLTVDHLLKFNCQYLDLELAMIRSKDLNQFLKHWQNGGCDSLKFLRAEKSLRGWTNITKGIKVEKVPNTVWRSYPGRRGGEDIITQESGGRDIKRNDGTIGTIFLRQGVFRFAVPL